MAANQSDVARLREQIEMETRAMRDALSAPAMIGGHDQMNHRYATITGYYHQLTDLVGKKQATDIMAEAYCRAIDADFSPNVSASSVGSEEHSPGC
jgi:hypothetical protein